jgi:hypothetical protein
MSRSCVKNGARRSWRLLAIVALGLGWGVWPSVAQANITCRARNFIVCDHYECCFVTCVTCTDSDGNVVGIDCETGDCYPLQN